MKLTELNLHLENHQQTCSDNFSKPNDTNVTKIATPPPILIIQPKQNISLHLENPHPTSKPSVTNDTKNDKPNFTIQPIKNIRLNFKTETEPILHLGGNGSLQKADVTSEIQEETNVYQHKCSICHKLFKKRPEVVRHVKFHHSR